MPYRVLEEYPRRPHLEFFRGRVSPFYSITFDLDATREWGGKAMELAERLGETEVLVAALSHDPEKAGGLDGSAIEWVRVHMLPDYAFFDHSAHINAGVGCVSCHGRVDEMEVVQQVQPLSMSWCLDCHRNPAAALRPLDQVTNMSWNAAEAEYDATRDAARRRQPEPPLHCSGCHR